MCVHAKRTSAAPLLRMRPNMRILLFFYLRVRVHVRCAWCGGRAKRSGDLSLATTANLDRRTRQVFSHTKYWCSTRGRANLVEVTRRCERVLSRAPSADCFRRGGKYQVNVAGSQGAEKKVSEGENDVCFSLTPCMPYDTRCLVHSRAKKLTGESTSAELFSGGGSPQKKLRFQLSLSGFFCSIASFLRQVSLFRRHPSCQ